MKQRKNSLTLGISLGLCSMLGSVAQAQTYDATADFNPGTYASNPNGVWRYGYTTLGGSFIQHTDSGTFGGQLQYWRTDIGSGAPVFEKNFGGSPLFGIQPGQIALHGGPNGEFGLLRFTAPSAGNYNLATSYFTGDFGNTDIYLLHNGNVVSSDPSTTGGGSFSLPSFFLGAGDTLDVAVGIGGDTYFSDTTPINHTITLASTSAPEPGTLGLLALGIMGGGILSRRKVMVSK